MQRKIFRLIEKHLYNQAAIEKAVKNAREEQVIGRASRIGGGGSGHAFISDPTASIAIKFATPINSIYVDGMGTVHNPEQWVTVMNDAYRGQPEWLRKLFKRRYYYRNSSVQYLAIEYNLSLSGCYNLCHEFVVDVALRAMSESLIKYTESK